MLRATVTRGISRYIQILKRYYRRWHRVHLHRSVSLTFQEQTHLYREVNTIQTCCLITNTSSNFYPPPPPGTHIVLRFGIFCSTLRHIYNMSPNKILINTTHDIRHQNPQAKAHFHVTLKRPSTHTYTQIKVTAPWPCILYSVRVSRTREHQYFVCEIWANTCTRIFSFPVELSKLEVRCKDSPEYLQPKNTFDTNIAANITQKTNNWSI